MVTFYRAAERAMAQRMDQAVDLTEQGLQAAQDRNPDQDLIFGESLLQLAGNQELSAQLAHRALNLAEHHGAHTLALIARARLALDPAGPTAADAPEIYQLSLAADNHYAAYLAASSVALQAAIRRDPATGLLWSDRIIALHRQHGIGQAPVVIEIRANLLTMADEPIQALRLYSAARHHNVRSGLPWPSRDITAALLAHATAQVDRTQYEDAWQSGRHLTLDDLQPSPDPHPQPSTPQVR